MCISGTEPSLVVSDPEPKRKFKTNLYIVWKRHVLRLN